MTDIEKIIAHFQEDNCKENTTFEQTCLNNFVIIALEKQKAKLVEHKKTFWRYTHYCSTCGDGLERESVKFCANCGQKLDWSNYWEALKYAR